MLRRPRCNDSAVLFSSTGTNVDDVVSTQDYVQVMLNDDDCSSKIIQVLEYLQQSLHIQRMGTNGRSKINSAFYKPPASIKPDEIPADEHSHRAS